MKVYLDSGSDNKQGLSVVFRESVEALTQYRNELQIDPESETT